MLVLNSEGIINRLICKNCNLKFFERVYCDKLFCSKDCRSSFKFKNRIYRKKKIIINN